MRELFRSVIGLTFIASALASTPESANGGKVAFELSRGHIILAKASMYDRPYTELNVMIDTGASHSVLTPAAARRINAHLLEANITGSAFGAESRLEKVIVRGLRLGKRTISMACYSAELPWPEVDLLLGLDVLSGVNFTIDFRRKEIAFAAAGRFSHTTRFERKAGLLLVNAAIGGQTYRLSIDSGAPYTCLMQARLEETLPFRMGQPATMQHVAGTSNIRTTVLPSLRLGSGEWKELPAWIVMSPDETRPAHDGVVGLASLNIERIGFDFERSEVSWD